jgi:hypothetical protein
MAQALLLMPTGHPALACSLAAIMPDTKPLQLPFEVWLAFAVLCSCTSIRLHMPYGQRPSLVQALLMLL